MMGGCRYVTEQGLPADHVLRLRPSPIVVEADCICLRDSASLAILE